MIARVLFFRLLLLGLPWGKKSKLKRDIPAAQAVLDAEVALGRRLIMMGFMRRFDPGYLELKGQFGENGIGDPIIVRNAHRNEVAPYGLDSALSITNAAIHEIDINRWLVDDEYGVLAGSHFGGDFGEVQVHRLGIAARQDERCALPVARADGAEDIGRGGTLIVGRRRPCPTPRPTPRDLVLLADPGLVGEPEFYVVGIDALVARDRRHAGGGGARYL